MNDNSAPQGANQASHPADYSIFSLMRGGILLVALCLALGLLLMGCASGDASGEVSDETPAGTNSDASNDTEEVAGAAAEEDETESPQEAKVANPTFGQTFTWENGLSINISKPAAYMPGEYSFVEQTDWTGLRFTVTVINKTGANYDVSMESVTMQSGNTEAEQAFDSEQGIEGAPSTKLLDGREAKYEIAFMAKDPKDLVMEFSPGDWDLGSVIFTS